MTTTPSAELARLEQVRETTHAEVQKIKRARNAFDAETQQLRSLAGRTAVLPSRGVRGSPEESEPRYGGSRAPGRDSRRMSEDNPHHADYEEALAQFHEADSAVAAFRNAHVQELIELKARADEARLRIGTARERIGSGEWIEPTVAG
jgi:hypothetical protein